MTTLKASNIRRVVSFACVDTVSNTSPMWQDVLILNNNVSKLLNIISFLFKNEDVVGFSTMFTMLYKLGFFCKLM